MRFGGRLQAAIEILENIARLKLPVSVALKEWGMAHRFAGSGDRAAIGNIVYDALRRKLSYQWRMDSDSAQALAFAAVTEIAGSPEKVAELLDQDRFAPTPLDPQQWQAWQSRDLSTAPSYIQADIAQWCVDAFEQSFGDSWIAQAQALSERPPLDLRVNTLKAQRDKVLHQLNHIDAYAGPYLDTAIRIDPIEGFGRHPNIQVEAAFQKGWIEVQDIGSQMVAALAQANDASQVLDFCAGAGGKTLSLAAQMQNRGQIHAYDAGKDRLAPIYDRLKRAGVRNCQVHSHKDALESLKEKLDIVLVDAPCTGTGTWRRRPDAKWRLTQSQLDNRLSEQAQILEQAATYVRPGGRLVYITCSVLPAENADQIRAFQNKTSQFSLVDMKQLVNDTFPNQSVNAIYNDYGLMLTPHNTATDGFYISVLQKLS